MQLKISQSFTYFISGDEWRELDVALLQRPSRLKTFTSSVPLTLKFNREFEERQLTVQVFDSSSIGYQLTLFASVAKLGDFSGSWGHLSILSKEAQIFC